MIRLKEVVSYTTRPIRENETDGVEHYFITEEEAQELMKNEQMIAYVKLGETGYTYFALANEIYEKGANCYIIDPKGAKEIPELMPGLRCKKIYIYSDIDTRVKRAKQRPGFDQEEFDKRIKNEDPIFVQCEKEANYDIMITNGDNLLVAKRQLIDYIVKNYDNTDLFLIMGRTCAGKDTLLREVKEYFNK